MHMREAIDKLMADFNRFLQENAGFQGCVQDFAPPWDLSYALVQEWSREFE